MRWSGSAFPKVRRRCGSTAPGPTITGSATSRSFCWTGAARGVDALIAKVRAAVEAYPYPHEYRAWPGPNSNTFTAFVARAVPELGLALPSIAVGKDYLPDGALVASAPSGTGWQVSVLGVVGLLLARAEGIEINLLGLNFGVDFAAPALLLPGIGRVGTARRPAA